MSAPINDLVLIFRRILFSDDEPRLRSLWRLGIHLILLTFCLGFLTAIALFLNIPLTDYTQLADLMFSQLIFIVALTAATYAARRYLDHRSFTSLGLKLSANALRDLALGFSISGLLIALIFIISLAFGWIEVKSFAWQNQTLFQTLSSLGIWFIFTMMISWGEELLARGYWFQNLRDGLSQTVAVILTSAIFALLHAMNFNATPIAIAWLFPAGIFLAYGLIRSNQLWLSLGLHLGWNFFEGPIFGFPVSGLNTYSLIKHINTGPALWTGGLFGPEAGLVILPILAIGILIIYWITKASGKANIKQE